MQDPSPWLRYDDKIKEEFDIYWAENGDKIVWDAWVHLYGEYLNEDPNTQANSENSAVKEKDLGDKDAEPSGYGSMWSNHEQSIILDENVIINEKPESQGSWGDTESKNSAAWSQGNETSSWGSAPAPSEAWSASAEVMSTKSDAKVEPQDVSVAEPKTLKFETWGSVKASSESWGAVCEHDSTPKESVDMSSWGSTPVKAETWGTVVQTENNVKESVDTASWRTTSAKAETWGSGPSQTDSWDSSGKEKVTEETKMSEDDQVVNFSDFLLFLYFCQ